MDLQELITRGRMLFARAPGRLAVFELVNGRRSAADIGQELGRRANHVYEDVRRLEDAELVRPKLDGGGSPKKKGGWAVYEKTPLARTVSVRYFRNGSTPGASKRPSPRPSKAPAKRTRLRRPLRLPS